MNDWTPDELAAIASADADADAAAQPAGRLRAATVRVGPR